MKNLRIHFFEHVSYEKPEAFAEWANEKGFRISRTRFYLDEPAPPLSGIDWLIIMGGPMGVHDDLQYDWLMEEKSYIKDAVAAGKTIVGVCLGAQLLADALGAKVYKNPYSEIGWQPVFLTDEGANHWLFNDFEHSFTVFHWHNDTYELPANAVHLLSTKTCPNQGFIYENRILGLQFHMEMGETAVREILDNNRHEMPDGPYVQQENEILNGMVNIAANVQKMKLILDRLARIQ